MKIFCICFVKFIGYEKEYIELKVIIIFILKFILFILDIYCSIYYLECIIIRMNFLKFIFY